MKSAIHTLGLLCTFAGLIGSGLHGDTALAVMFGSILVALVIMDQPGVTHD